MSSIVLGNLWSNKETSILGIRLDCKWQIIFPPQLVRLIFKSLCDLFSSRHFYKPTRVLPLHKSTKVLLLTCFPLNPSFHFWSLYCLSVSAHFYCSIVFLKQYFSRARNMNMTCMIIFLATLSLTNQIKHSENHWCLLLEDVHFFLFCIVFFCFITVCLLHVYVWSCESRSCCSMSLVLSEVSAPDTRLQKCPKQWSRRWRNMKAQPCFKAIAGSHGT